MKSRPSYLVRPADIERMMTEYRRGEEAFFAKYGAGPSTRYDLVDSAGRRYPPAAIYQAAAQWSDVRGGLKAPGSAGRRLRSLGFRIIEKGDPLPPGDKQIDRLLAKLRGIIKTESHAIGRRRIGTHDLRKLVMMSRGRCEVSDISDEQLLIVSHIVPWAENTDDRLDPDNVILLSALWDTCFDRGLVSFSDTGQALYSETLSDGARGALHASERRFLNLSNERCVFLQRHRQRYGF